MKARHFTAVCLLGCVPLLAKAQASPASAPSPISVPVQPPAPPAATPAQAAPIRAAQTHTSAVGFSYSIPLDWEVVDAQPMLPVVKQQEAQKFSSAEAKKGVACVQIALLARDGNPPSVIEAIVLPYDCFGQTLTDADLPGFAGGVAGGLKNNFDITNPVYGAYMLGPHHMWIERATGSFIAHPEIKRSIETVCSLLKKGAVCWVVLAADPEALQTFENGPITLDGYAAPALVPADALVKKP